jgi:hypothetical protein
MFAHQRSVCFEMTSRSTQKLVSAIHAEDSESRGISEETDSAYLEFKL